MKPNEVVELEKAIKHCKEIVDRTDNCDCVNEHKQLMKWLSELKTIKEKEYKPKMKQNEVIEILNACKGTLVLTHDKDKWIEVTPAITEAIRCVEENEKQKELIAELVEALEEEIKSWNENITDEDAETFIARHADILKKVKGSRA